MTCTRCGAVIGEDAAYCQHCGANQHTPAGPSADKRYLRRSLVDRQIAGVCGGIARYADIDPVIVRIIWVVLTIVPGVFFLGIIGYLAAWLIIPEAQPASEPADVTADDSWRGRRLRRSSTDAKLGGVCAGIAVYLGVDPTATRVLWVVLSIFPGAIICGVIAYAVAWFIMPVTPVALEHTPATATPGSPESS